MAASFWDLYAGMDFDKQAEFLRSMFRPIVLSHEGVVGHVLREPFARLIEAGLIQEREERTRRQAQSLVDADLAA